MMKIATPISTLFDNPADAERILALSDCLECRDHSVESTLPGQEIFHFDHEIIHPWSDADRNYIQGVINSKTKLKLISFHLASTCSKPVIIDGKYELGGEKFTREQMIDFAKKNAQWLRTALKGRNVSIAVENNNYYPTQAYETVTDADFISEIVHTCDLMFVFDLAHAKITAHNKQQDYEHYISQLPFDTLKQIHLSQYEINQDDLALDMHSLPGEETIKEFKEYIHLYQPEYVTVEYYKECDGLIRTISALQSIKEEVAL